MNYFKIGVEIIKVDDWTLSSPKNPEKQDLKIGLELCIVFQFNYTQWKC